MESNNILNKTLKLAKEVIQNSGAQMNAIEKMMPSLKKELLQNDPQAYEQITQLQKSLRNGDIQKIIEIKNNLYANNK